MTDTTPQIPLPAGTATIFSALLETGKASGHLSLDQLVHELAMSSSTWTFSRRSDGPARPKAS